MDLKSLGKLLRITSIGLASVVMAATGAANAQSLIRDAEIEETLREYGTPLFIAGGLNPDDVDIYIVNDPSLNAFVAGGQNMFLHTGFLLQAETPGEIIGVMAHEAGHMIGGHNITRQQAMGSAMGTSWIALGLGVIAIAAGAPDAGAAIIGSSQQAALLTFFKYTRVEEGTADQIGLSLLEATGMPADGLVSFMEEIRNSEVMSVQRQDPYYRTHPEVGPRIAALRQRSDDITAKANPLPEHFVTEMDMMQAKLMGFLEPRAAFVNYPPTDLSKPARYARAIAAHQNHDLAHALKEIEALVELEPENPYFHELHGQILFENSRFEESVAPHRRSVELAPNKALLYVNLARSLISLNTPESSTEAEALLHKALLLEPANAFAWKQMSFALGALGRDAEAELATAESAYVIGDHQTAYMFARRAMEDLPANTPKWRRADDIAAVTDPRITGNTRGLGPSNRRFNHAHDHTFLTGR